MKARERAELVEALVQAVPVGRDNAIPLRHVRAIFGRRHDRWLAASTMRAWIHDAQELGFDVLTSPRAGVWVAANDDEILDVIEELRAGVTALEERMFLINGGKCAYRKCRATLPEKVVKRRGLYCRPEHRYLAAAERNTR